MEKLNRKLIRKMIIEEAIIIKRQKILHEQNIRISMWCASKEKRMLSQGYSRREVNESIMKSLMNESAMNEFDLGGAGGDIMKSMLGLGKDTATGVGGGFLDTIEQMFIEKLLSTLFGSYDPDSFIGVVIANVLENIDYTELGKYLGDGACDPIVDMLYNGISEAIAQKGISKLFGDRSDSGLLVSTMRESFTNALNNTEFQLKIKESIKNTVCSMDFGSIASTLKKGFGSLVGGVKNMIGGQTPVTP